MEKRIDQLIQYMNAIEDISKHINFSTNLNNTKGDILDKAMKLMQVESISVLLIDEKKGEMYFDICRGVKSSEIEGKKDTLRFKVGQGIAGWVAKMGKPVIINDPAKHPNFYKEIDSITGYVTRNIACVPLMIKNRVKGVVEAINKRDSDFEDIDRIVLGNIGALIAVSMENIELYDKVIQIKNYYMNIIESMPGGLIVMDKAGTIMSCNKTACKILGLLKAVTIGKPCKVALMRQKEMAVVLIKTLAEKKSVNRLELKTMGNGNERIVIGYGTIIINELSGEVAGVGMIFQDLTHIKEIKDRAEKMLT